MGVHVGENSCHGCQVDKERGSELRSTGGGEAAGEGKGRESCCCCC